MGNKERKERDRQNKMKLFLDEAEKLFFSKGYENTTMDEIAEKAEYSKGTIYLYFGSKEVILLHIILRGLNLLINVFSETMNTQVLGIGKIGVIGMAYNNFMTRYNGYYEMITKVNQVSYHDPKNEEVLKILFQKGAEIDKIMASALTLGIKDGSVRADLNVDLTVQLLQYMSDGVFQHIGNISPEKEHLTKISKEEIFTGFFEFVNNSIKS